MNATAQSSTAFQDETPNYRPSSSNIVSFSTHGSKVRVSQPGSRWVGESEDRFNELTSLPIGRDGYVGQPVSFDCAHFTANLSERLFIDNVPAPQLVPVADGSSQLEWHLNQFDIEIDVLGPCDVVAYRTDLLTDEEVKIEIKTDFTESAELVVALGQDRAAARKEFAEKMAAIYSSIAERQEPLGAEFEAVWDANVADLYEA